MIKITVAEYIARRLVFESVKYVFGYTGSAMLKIAHEVDKRGINFIHNYHEQGSSFCAGGLAKYSSKLGVVLTTSGPGATNIITGLADAYLDSVPVLFITGQDKTTNLSDDQFIRQSGFQDLDIVSAVSKITKYAKRIDNPLKAKETIEEAIWLAKKDRMGATLIDIPIDIQYSEIDFNHNEMISTVKRITPNSCTFRKEDYKKVENLIRNSKKPLILLGGGSKSKKSKEILKEIILFYKIPIVSTLNGLDSTEETLGFAGIYGNYLPNNLLRRCDLLIALGTRFGNHHVSNRINEYTNANIIHIEIDESERQRVFIDSLGLNLDVSTFLEEFYEILNNNFGKNFFWKKWIDEINFLKKERDKFESSRESPQTNFLTKLFQNLPENICITADVGQNQMWVAQSYISKPGRKLINSVGLGAMGSSLPSAIGASFADREKMILCITGDGGFQINIQELSILKLYKLNIKILIMNNSSLGMITEVQDKYYEGRYLGSSSREYTCPSFKDIARAYNLQYISVKLNTPISEFEYIFESKEPYIIELEIPNSCKTLTRYDYKISK